MYSNKIIFIFWCSLNFFFFVFLGLHLQHMEVPRLGIKLELQLLAYTTATAMWDPSHVFNLHHSSQQCRILNPLSRARDQTHVLINTSQVCYHWATMETPVHAFYTRNSFTFHKDSRKDRIPILQMKKPRHIQIK